MPDLYLSALGTPFRAVVASTGGQRAFVKISDRRSDEFALDPIVWIDRDGALAGTQSDLLRRAGNPGDFARVAVLAQDEIRGDTRAAADVQDELAMPWTARDRLAVVFRRALSAAEAQSGESIARIVCVVPSAASENERSSVAQAAHLAGALAVEVVPLDALAAAAEAVVEVWDDCARAGAARADGSWQSLDVAGLSKAFVLARLRDAIDSAGGLPAEISDGLTEAIFDVWAGPKAPSRGVAISRAAGRGAPVSVFVSRGMFSSLDALVTETLGRALATLGGAERFASISVVGSWARPVANALRTLAGVSNVRDDRGLEIEAAVAHAPPAGAARHVLSSDLLAVAPKARTLRALSQGESITLMRAGARLPATVVSENFASNSFIETFSLAAGSDPAPTLMLSFAIPRYAERQANSYLRAVAHCETPDLMLLEVSYLYPSSRRFAFYDKTNAKEIPVPDYVARALGK